jgi:hypothetical protein
MAKPKTEQGSPRARTEPTMPALAGGAYDEQGMQIEKLQDAPPPERKE